MKTDEYFRNDSNFKGPFSWIKLLEPWEVMIVFGLPGIFIAMCLLMIVGTMWPWLIPGWQ
jgi:hypothetical protein